LFLLPKVIPQRYFIHWQVVATASIISEHNMSDNFQIASCELFKISTRLEDSKNAFLLLNTSTLWKHLLKSDWFSNLLCVKILRLTGILKYLLLLLINCFCESHWHTSYSSYTAFKCCLSFDVNVLQRLLVKSRPADWYIDQRYLFFFGNPLRSPPYT
jgi:hypothetical protein